MQTAKGPTVDLGGSFLRVLKKEGSIFAWLANTGMNMLMKKNIVLLAIGAILGTQSSGIAQSSASSSTGNRSLQIWGNFQSDVGSLNGSVQNANSRLQQGYTAPRDVFLELRDLYRTMASRTASLSRAGADGELARHLGSLAAAYQGESEVNQKRWVKEHTVRLNSILQSRPSASRYRGTGSTSNRRTAGNPATVQAEINSLQSRQNSRWKNIRENQANLIVRLSNRYGLDFSQAGSNQITRSSGRGGNAFSQVLADQDSRRRMLRNRSRERASQQMLDDINYRNNDLSYKNLSLSEYIYIKKRR